MCEIEDIRARQILDSRGNPTVEVDVKLIDGSIGRASVPSGASTGIYEAKELRDNVKGEYMGKGVQKAIDNINSIITPNLLGEDAFDQQLIDGLMMEMDGSFNKSTLGANAMLAVSLACARAGLCGSLRNTFIQVFGRFKRKSFTYSNDEYSKRRGACK